VGEISLVKKITPKIRSRNFAGAKFPCKIKIKNWHRKSAPTTPKIRSRNLAGAAGGVLENKNFG
jgi:hypothetical protein